MSEYKGGTVYPPAEAARLLGVSVSGLRRYGLPLRRRLRRAPQGRRLWTPEAITRLWRAKALIAEGRAVSIQAALEADETPVQDEPELQVSDPSTEAFTRLTDALNVIVRLEQTNRQLVHEVAALRERLEQGDPNAEELRRMNTFLMSELERYRNPAPGAANVQDDSVMGRALRWLERRLRGGVQLEAPECRRFTQGRCPLPRALSPQRGCRYRSRR